MGYISEEFLKDFATRQKTYNDNKVSFVSDSIGLDDVSSFSPTKQYSIGERVIYNNKVYKFKVGHKGAWDINDIDETNLFSEIDDLAKLDYEQVIIELKGENDEVLPNVSVTVTVEGDADARNLTTDELGKCTTKVQKGLQYIISCNDVSGYLPVSPISRRAAIATRVVEVIYVVDERLTQEHVKVTVNYAGTPETTATEIYFSTDGGQSITDIGLVNNVAEFDVPFGVDYQLSFEPITGYSTPKTRNYRAEHHGTRAVAVRYNLPISDVMWVMNDDTARRAINAVTKEEMDNGDVFGLAFMDSSLIAPVSEISEYSEKECYFIVPLDVLKSGSLLNYAWGSNAVSTENITAWLAAGGINMHYDGEENCKGITNFIEYCKQQVPQKSAGSPMVTYSYNRSYLAEQFVSSRYYNKGRYVIYNDNLYQFNTYHSANTAWNNTEVTLVYKSFNVDEAYSIGERIIYNGYLYEFINNHLSGDSWDYTSVKRIYGYLMPDGQIKNCFVGARKQYISYINNYDNIQSVISSIFEFVPIKFERVCLSESGNVGGNNSNLAWTKQIGLVPKTSQQPIFPLLPY